MAQVPNKTPHGHRARDEELEEIAVFKARQEALEVYDRRQLLREEVRLARQRHNMGRIEIGERRVALIARIVLSLAAIVSAVASATLGALGQLRPEVAVAVSLVCGALASAAVWSAKVSGKQPQQ